MLKGLQQALVKLRRNIGVVYFTRQVQDLLSQANSFATLTPPLPLFVAAKEAIQHIREYSEVAKITATDEAFSLATVEAIFTATVLTKLHAEYVHIKPKFASSELPTIAQLEDEVCMFHDNVLSQSAAATHTANSIEVAGAIANDRRKQQESKRRLLAQKVQCPTCHKPGHGSEDCWVTNKNKREEYFKKCKPAVKAGILKQFRPVCGTKSRVFRKTLSPPPSLFNYYSVLDNEDCLDDSFCPVAHSFGDMAVQSLSVQPSGDMVVQSLSVQTSGDMAVQSVEAVSRPRLTWAQAVQAAVAKHIASLCPSMGPSPGREQHLGAGYQISPRQPWFTLSLHRQHTVLVSGSAAILARAKHIIDPSFGLPEDRADRLSKLHSVREDAGYLEVHLRDESLMVRTSFEDLKSWAFVLGVLTRALIQSVDSHAELISDILGYASDGDDDEFDSELDSKYFLWG
ncbi:hypothetical protein CYMTET_28484 [Cymbomonas tetramitiformis]|uniref:Uncharacterized protein n=1 Tax=Cymbomonas tetramitiformis TaxID=36881 RepID=A0AAE0FMQ6_9CHLO|nr:hypothetical protein CYMTET_28484 [Cymbomonas tetramitiformis]